MFNRFSRNNPSLQRTRLAFALMQLRSRPLLHLWLVGARRLFPLESMGDLTTGGGEPLPFYEEDTKVGDADELPFYGSSEIPENVQRFRSAALAKAKQKRAMKAKAESRQADERPQREYVQEERLSVKKPAMKPAEEVDFKIIKGIGPSFDRLLKAANVRTFAQLAAMTTEDLAEILGWPAARIRRDDLIGQAKILAGEPGVYK